MATWISPLFLLLLFSGGAAAGSPASPLYSEHCISTVPSANLTGPLVDDSASFSLFNGYFSGGQPLLSSPLPGSFYLRPRSLHQTTAPGILRLAATLSLRPRGLRFLSRNLSESRRPSLIHPRAFFARDSYGRGRVSLELSGFWSEATGLLCMVGEGFPRSTAGNPLHLSAVVKLSFPKKANITTSLVAGQITSLDADSPSHFDPISLFAYAQRDYSYTKISDARDSCSRVDLKEESLGLGKMKTKVCSYLPSYLGGRYILEYGNDCSDENCGPFAKKLGFYPKFLSLNLIRCDDDGKLHMFIGFSNYSGYGFRTLLAPETSLVAEGLWDHEKNRLCMVACRILNEAGSSRAGATAAAGDCTIGFRLWFPAVLSIETRGTIVGRLWSNRAKKDSGHFGMVSFWSSETYHGTMIPGLKYKYTKLDSLSNSCVATNVPNWGEKLYPSGRSAGEMKFDISLRDAEGRRAWGFAVPRSLGEDFLDNTYVVYARAPSAPRPPAALVDLSHSLFNVSYEIMWSLPNSSYDGSGQTKISAEGVYNALTGRLCMVGCRYVDATISDKQVKGPSSIDCEIMINIQLSPLNPEAGEHLNGTVRSTRKKSDPLFFEQLETVSYAMYTPQAVESIWRMDIEITMVLISLTLSCIFIGCQLFYLNKHPDVLPSISITMLVILTLGHMIPLVLNFEALFVINRNRQNVLLWSGGWLEANEVIVRVITMIAFLMQFRFLQVTWFARHKEESKKGLWAAEWKALQVCLPLYFVGGLIAWFVHSGKSETLLRRQDFITTNHHSLWEDLISYAGLILDGFLLPQILLNISWNSKDKALSPVFYVGTTIVRAMPHLYDTYRARHYLPHLNSSYIYASPDGDFYTSAWDIIIPCEGVLFLVLIFLQQRFGGRCILPARFRLQGGYETVPSISL